jgi:hypothetical protein
VNSITIAMEYPREIDLPFAQRKVGTLRYFHSCQRIAQMKTCHAPTCEHRYCVFQVVAVIPEVRDVGEDPEPGHFADKR